MDVAATPTVITDDCRIGVRSDRKIVALFLRRAVEGGVGCVKSKLKSFVIAGSKCHASWCCRSKAWALCRSGIGDVSIVFLAFGHEILDLGFEHRPAQFRRILLIGFFPLQRLETPELVIWLAVD